MRRKKRNHLPGFKAKVALAAIKGDKTLENDGDTRTLSWCQNHPSQQATQGVSLFAAGSGN